MGMRNLTHEHRLLPRIVVTRTEVTTDTKRIHNHLSYKLGTNNNLEEISSRPCILSFSMYET